MNDLFKTLLLFVTLLLPISITLSNCVHKDQTDWPAITNYIIHQEK